MNNTPESKRILPEYERLVLIDLIADSVEIEYCVKYHKALESAESELEEMRKENEMLKEELKQIKDLVLELKNAMIQGKDWNDNINWE